MVSIPFNPSILLVSISAILKSDRISCDDFTRHAFAFVGIRLDVDIEQ